MRQFIHLLSAETDLHIKIN